LNEDSSNGWEQGAECRCPRCGSPGIKLGYPDMECLRCGWREPLIDFPISWDWHRYYCYLFGKPDPGPCEPPEHPELKAIEERLERIEQTLADMSSEEFRQLKLKHIYDEVQDIRQGFRRIDQIVAQSIRKRQPARTLKPKLTEL